MTLRVIELFWMMKNLLVSGLTLTLAHPSGILILPFESTPIAFFCQGDADYS